MTLSRCTRVLYGTKCRATLLQAPQEGDEVAFFLLVELQREHQVEELHRVVQRQQPAVVVVGRRIFDAAERERLDRAVGRVVSGRESSPAV